MRDWERLAWRLPSLLADLLGQLIILPFQSFNKLPVYLCQFLYLMLSWIKKWLLVCGVWIILPAGCLCRNLPKSVVPACKIVFLLLIRLNTDLHIVSILKKWKVIKLLPFLIILLYNKNSIAWYRVNKKDKYLIGSIYNKNKFLEKFFECYNTNFTFFALWMHSLT